MYKYIAQSFCYDKAGNKRNINMYFCNDIKEYIIYVDGVFYSTAETFEQLKTELKTAIKAYSNI